MSDRIKKERSFVLIKPDGVQRGLVGEIIKRFEQSGLKLVGMKMLVPTSDLIEKHYLLDSQWKEKTGEKAIQSYEKKGKKPPSTDVIAVGEVVLANLKKYLTASPVIVMVWQGMHVVGIVRKIVGGTEPLTSDVGTIRGDFTIDSYEIADLDSRAVRNLIHASGSNEEAEKEIGLWFKENEIAKYRLIHDEILYDVNTSSNQHLGTTFSI